MKYYSKGNFQKTCTVASQEPATKMKVQSAQYTHNPMLSVHSLFCSCSREVTNGSLCKITTFSLIWHIMYMEETRTSKLSMLYRERSLQL